MKHLLALLPIGALLMPVPAIAKPATFTSKYTKAELCKELASGDVRAGEDWVYFRCEGLGGIPIWYRCSDASHCKYGFGRRANLSGWFGVDGDPNWKIEWRGRFVGKRFEPFAVIKRASWRSAGVRNPFFVFRLRADGSSCVIGDNAYSNEEARKIADAASGNYRCVVEPELP